MLCEGTNSWQLCFKFWRIVCLHNLDTCALVFLDVLNTLLLLVFGLFLIYACVLPGWCLCCVNGKGWRGGLWDVSFFCPVLWVLPWSSCWGGSGWIASTVVVDGPAAAPASCHAERDERAEGVCPRSGCLVACCPRSNSSTPSVPVVPILEKVMVVPGSGVVRGASGGHSPAANHAWLVCAPLGSWLPWWGKRAVVALATAASRVSLTCWPDHPRGCLLGTPLPHLQVRVSMPWHRLVFCPWSLASPPLLSEEEEELAVLQWDTPHHLFRYAVFMS